MLSRSRSIYWFLAASGGLPFVIAAVAAVTHLDLPWVTAEWLATSYGLAIVCFLCGTHWAVELFVDTVHPRPNLLIVSNVVLLLAWFAVLILPAAWAAVLLAASLLALLWVDAGLRQVAVIEAAYWQMRKLMTAIAASCLLVVAATS